MILTRLRRFFVCLALALAFLSGSLADSFAEQRKTVHVKEYKPSPPSSSSTAKRDANGRIERSGTAKHHFEVQSGYPHGRPGYVVDHIRPLACGGPDTPANMQWQTAAEAKAKDKWERAGCR